MLRRKRELEGKTGAGIRNPREREMSGRKFSDKSTEILSASFFLESFLVTIKWKISFWKKDFSSFGIISFFIEVKDSFILTVSIQADGLKAIFNAIVFREAHQLLSKSLSLVFWVNSQSVDHQATIARIRPVNAFVFFFLDAADVYNA